MSTEQMGMEVATVEEKAVARQEDTPQIEGLTLIERALDRGVDMETIERLVALQERKEARDAERAMAEALAAFQAECPAVRRVGTADVRKNGQVQYSYGFAPYDEIVRVIREPLAKHGLSYTHDTKMENSTLTVTCTLQHVAGARRSATFTGPFDNSGGKNPLQGIGSTRSYGKRYTLTDVLGLATEEDDDGVGSHGADAPTVNDAQLKRLNELADEAGADKAAFCKLMGVESMAAIPVTQYNLAQLTLKKKIEAKEAGDE